MFACALAISSGVPPYCFKAFSELKLDFNFSQFSVMAQGKNPSSSRVWSASLSGSIGGNFSGCAERLRDVRGEIVAHQRQRLRRQAVKFQILQIDLEDLKLYG